MQIGVARLQVSMYATSLKEKRSYLRPIKDKVRNDFNISIAEVALQEQWQNSELGLAMITFDRDFFQKTVHKIIAMIERKGEMEVTGYDIDYC